MIFEHDVCPVCGQQFTPCDDVVVCPECGTPHHRACYAQNGGCAHADAHADGFVWTSASREQAPEPAHRESADSSGETVCTHCGAVCDADALVCPECGKPLGFTTGDKFDYNDEYFLRGVDADPAQDLDGFTVREAALFVQFRTSDYVRKFTRMQNGRKCGWNWAAFFFSPFWFFFRKIRKAGALFLGILLVLAVFAAIPVSKVQQQALSVVQEHVSIDESTSPEDVMAQIAALDAAQRATVQNAIVRYSRAMLVYAGVLFLPNFAAAIVADFLYKNKIRKDVQSMREFSKNDRTFRLLALRRGGVSVFGLLGSFLVFNLFINLILISQ